MADRTDVLVLRCAVPGAAAGVWPRTGEALADPLPHLRCLWTLHHNRWLQLGLEKGRSWGGGYDGKAKACFLIVTHSPRARSQNQSSLLRALGTLSTESDITRQAARGRHCQLRHQPPGGWHCRGLRPIQPWDHLEEGTGNWQRASAGERDGLSSPIPELPSGTFLQLRSGSNCPLPV